MASPVKPHGHYPPEVPLAQQKRRAKLHAGEFVNGKRHRPVHKGDEPPPIDVPVSPTERASLVPMHHPPETDQPDAPPPPAGYRYSMVGKLVPLMESRVSLSTQDGQTIFLEVLEVTGNIRAAMDAIGMMSHASLNGALERMPDFNERFEAAMERHRATIYKAAHARAVHGYDVPIIGGQFKDEIVAYERKYSDSLMAMMLKRHIKEFAETSGKGANVTVNNSTTNQTATLGMVDLSTLTKKQRDQLRGFLAESPDTPEPETDSDPSLIEEGPGPGMVIDVPGEEE